MQLINAKYLRVLWLVVLAVLAGSSALVYGQGTSGSLSGQVTDPAGAALVGATVTVTDVDTNYPLTVKTNSDGIYQVKPLPLGNYKLRIFASGFAEYVQTGIVISANQYATQDVRLKIATAKGETVSVTADAELIDTTSAELGMTVNEESVADLPLLNRDTSGLALLAPGMVDAGKAGIVWTQAGFSFPDEVSASSNGGRIGSTYYMLDGVSNMDNYLGTNSPAPNADATQEFRLISNNFSAVYGFSTGGVVSMATRSGTNKWHGGLFEFMRNEDFDAGDWSNHIADKYRQNQYGGYVGGPVLKDKLFFFFNYQATEVLGSPGSSTNATSVPTQQMLTGDFSGLVDYAIANSNGKCGTTYADSPQTTNCGWLNGPFQIDPSTGKPNQLVGGAASLDKAAVQFATDGLPGNQVAASGTSPTLSTTPNLRGDMYYPSAAVANTSTDQYTSRVDYDLSSSQRLTVRSFIDKFVAPATDIPGNVLSVLPLNSWNYTFGQNMWYFNEILQHTWTVNSTTVNTVTALWTQQSAHNGGLVHSKSGSQMCWSKYINVTEPGGCYMEGFAIYGNGQTTRGGWTEPANEVRSTEGISDTLIKTIHNHAFSTGIDLIKQRAVENAAGYPAYPIITFGGGYTGNGTADFLQGQMSTFTQGAGELADIQGWQIDPYVNDEYRVMPGLTLTLGLRWDPDFAPVSVGGRGAAFVAGQQSTIFPNAPTGLIYPGDHGMDAALRPSSINFFEPRVGMAYQPKNMPHTSFHAAFGIFSGPVPYSDYNHVVDIAPFATTLAPNAPSNSPICSTGGITASCTPNTGQTITGAANFDNPWETAGWNFGGGNNGPFQAAIPFATVSYKPPTNSAIPSPLNLGASFGRNFKAGKTQAWNATIEQQLSNVMSMRVAYVGGESYHQSYVQDDNYAAYSYCTSYTNPTCPIPQLAPQPTAPYSNFQQLLEYDSGATANYQSLQATFQRRMAHGLQGQSSFTWQKTIDVAQSANIAASQNGITDPRNLGWSRGVSGSSIPFTWISNFIYHSPELMGQSLIVREALAGWEISPIATWQSGTPFSIGSGSPNAVYSVVIPGQNGGNPVYEPSLGSVDGCLQACSGGRADRVPGIPLKVRQGGKSHWTKQYFNPAAFTTAHDGTFGNSARNLIQGPPGFSTDASLMKNWSILERYQLQFRFELFNAFNHPIQSNPDTWPTDGTFGEINSGNPLGSPSNGTRIGQAALKLTF